MKNTLNFLIGLLFGIMATYIYYQPDNDSVENEAQIIQTELKNLRKLVVVEQYYSQTFTYKNSEKYFYDYFQFDKKAMIMVNAKVQAGYDLKKMDIELDSIKKIIRIKHMPEAEVEINPTVKYLDFQQSSLNQFIQKDLNRIQKIAIEKIKNKANISDLRKKSEERFIAELKNIYILSKALGWKVENTTSTKIND